MLFTLEGSRFEVWAPIQTTLGALGPLGPDFEAAGPDFESAGPDSEAAGPDSETAQRDSCVCCTEKHCVIHTDFG